MENLSPDQAAAFVRVRWGIGERPIGNMLNLLESKGVRVFSLAEETRHLDAYSFWRDGKQPYIFLNTLKTAERTRFDAAHELGHLVMHRHSGATNPNAEIEANAFASAFLMPPVDLLAEIPVARSLEQIVAAKHRWGVSASALCYALNKHGRLTEWHYRSYNIAIAQMKDEPNPLPRETSQIWTKILTDLWRQGMPLARVAEELAIPEWELNALLFGIASTQAPGAPPPARGPLRLVGDGS
jgi:Zn-dependent peptidase ImmA (M78 family)